MTQFIQQPLPVASSENEHHSSAIGAEKTQSRHATADFWAAEISKALEDPEVKRVLESFARKVGEFLAPLMPALKAFGTALRFVAEAISKLPAALQEAVFTLMHRGWFFDPNMPLSQWWVIHNMIVLGNVVEADQLMAEHFESRLDEIEDELSSALPHRASKFKSGFAAHRRGEYDLSILAFLSQADGVCKELRGGHFFLVDKYTRLPEAAEYAATFGENPIERIVHMALAEKLPIRVQMSKRAAVGLDLLNRHAVMHGESLDHDTKENSLRAISLLNYVALSLNMDDGSAFAEAKASPVGSLLQMRTVDPK
ncbi:hypothetical protein [Polaromonas sp. JS666]|uniref:hypothetical protein n=1 Tax=Polaromonas sp. (strain JS666 / ATCC BAA-500) TaxID=296591 RepID=UPI000888E654|nr:hypothetical protein [Polaromonas sp. JS666]SDM44170.1 hypothetical protein SAMN05720382_101364 [Polaromonas sp. JS666]